MSKLETARQLAKQTAAQEPSMVIWERQVRDQQQVEDQLDKEARILLDTMFQIKSVTMSNQQTLTEMKWSYFKYIFK